jgi:hypothetical protein
MDTGSWSASEKKAARAAFDLAYDRETRAILDEVRSMLNAAKDPDVVWRIHDYLSKRRREVGEKYDYRYSQLIFVFARLLHEGWLTEDDLSGLRAEKIEQMKVWLRL